MEKEGGIGVERLGAADEKGFRPVLQVKSGGAGDNGGEGSGMKDGEVAERVDGDRPSQDGEATKERLDGQRHSIPTGPRQMDSYRPQQGGYFGERPRNGDFYRPAPPRFLLDNPSPTTEIRPRPREILPRPRTPKESMCRTRTLISTKTFRNLRVHKSFPMRKQKK